MLGKAGGQDHQPPAFFLRELSGRAAHHREVMAEEALG